MRKATIFMVLVALPLLWSGCSKDEDKEMRGHIAVVTNIANPDGISGQGFLALVDGYPSDEELGTQGAIPIAYEIAPVGYKRWLFTFPEWSGKTENVIRRYDWHDNRLTEGPKLNVAPESNPMSMAFASDHKAYVSLWGQGNVLIIDPSTMKQLGEIDLTQYGEGDNNPNPAAMFLRNDGVLFVGLNQTDATSMPAKPHAEIALIDTKTDQVLKVIKDSVHGLGFCGRPIDPGSFQQMDNGDLYVGCVGSFGTNPAIRSGYLRIKAGAMDFDPDYILLLPETSVTGYPHPLGFMLQNNELGGGKNLAYIWIPALNPNGPQGQMSDLAADLFVVDLPNRTIEHVNGMIGARIHGGTGARTAEGNVLIPASTSQGQGLIVYDAATQSTNPKPVVRTSAIPSWVYIFE